LPAWFRSPSPRPYKRENALYLLVVFPILAFILLTGQFGLEPVETALWGGLLVTLVVAIVGIVVSFPLGILLALGRRSEMPIIKMFCIIFIEFWRGVPLITVLFMSSVMLPLFLPEGVTFDKLLRALIGVALFSSAYMAEVIRGGLQAIPKGQYEAANAMALTFWQGTRLVIMPQALKLVIPGIVNTFIGLFKDTSLVLIIGLFDLLGIVQQNMNDPELDFTCNAGDRLRLCGVRLLHLLLRHVALLRLYGAASRYRPQT
jgi:general L-amino acid transport system permease protein